MDNFDFFKTSMPKTRKADFYLGCLDGWLPIQALKNQEGVIEARDIAINKINNDDLSITNYEWNYGRPEFWDGVTDANVVTSFLGSYTTKITVEDNEDGSYELNYEVNNHTGWESGTRLRQDINADGTHDEIIPNKERGEGIHLGGTISQKFTWSETVIP